MQVSFQIVLSPMASTMVRRMGAPQLLGVELARTLDDCNEDSLTVIRSRLNVAGNSKRGKKESATGSYEYPHKVTSRLQNSISRTKSVITGGGGSLGVSSVIGSGSAGGKDAVSYAHLQEYGGTVEIPSRARTSKNPKYLKAHPGPTKSYSVKIPARPFLRPTVKERQPIYSRRLSRTVKDFFGGKG